MSQTYTYGNPVLSLWQASVAEVQRRHASVQSRMATATRQRVAIAAQPAPDDLMAPVRLIGEPVTAGQTVSMDTLAATPAKAAPSVAVAPMTVAGVIGDCAKTAAKFLWAEMTGNHQQSQLLAGELKDSECDPLWAECVTTYLAYKVSGGALPYRPNLDPVINLGAATKLAIIGDWGTGDEVAINLLQQVAALGPDVLIHLGDIYYAGTQSEAQSNFLDICRQFLGSGTPLFSLCGNHDMYSGGNGYYWLVDQLNQQASYFCLQNADWQFLAMDTGHNDNDPLTVSTNMTGLVTSGNWVEANWHLAKIQQAGGRKTVLLSHHQLLSAFGSVGSVNGQKYAYNPNLYGSFQGVLPQVAAWFWGHEHTLAVYEPYMGLQMGCCVGASAVPVFTNQQSYASAAGLQTYQGAQMPVWNPGAVLGNNGTDYNNAFAMITLNGQTATVDYYQVPPLGTATKFGVSDTL
ncbi:metallophosphoesterase family protein [Terracidiphilus sp.]|uniref:metallophosphoesterase family protein n=1 Tax=Terracidiphilus sp. TaxID=1964191 RepID=UPI003C27A958